MKKHIGIVTILTALTLLLSLALCGGALAETLGEGRSLLLNAESFGEQLAIIDRLATDNAAELESGGWENDLTANVAPGLPDGLIPEDWDAYVYTEAEGLPEEMRGHKFIALYCYESSEPEIAGDLLARFPADMRAVSLEEAEYALIVHVYRVESGYKYIPAATSYHCDHAAYAVNLETGESVRFWTYRSGAKGSGKMSELSGKALSQQNLWKELRSQFLGELTYTQADGTVLAFGVTGENCYLKGYEGELTTLDVPAEVEGHTVTEIAENCFSGNKTLKSVVLNEGLQRISDKAFDSCDMLENVVLPSTLEQIGEEAFSGCSKLRQIAFPDSLRALGEMSFWGARSLESVALPGTIENIGYGVFMYGEKLSRVVVGEGITSLSDNLFDECPNVACYYFPSSLTSGLDENIVKDAVIYAPADSCALAWAAENGYECVACASPDDMPPVEYITEGDFEYRVFRGEAALSAYLGSDENVVVPESAGGVPVTRVLSHAVYNLDVVKSITLPQSVRKIDEGAIYAVDKSMPFDLYIPNPETSFDKSSVGRYGYQSKTPVTLHAPEGSLAQRYVTDMSSEKLAFEPWGEGIDPDARSLSDALAMAAQVQQSVATFWETCDQTEYASLKRIPGYDMTSPEAAAMLRVTQAQFDDLTLLMGGTGNVAASFASIVNTQFNLPYAKAAAKTAQTAKLDPVADGSCAFVVLCYRTDIVLVALSGDGDAQAALVCSSPEIIKGMSADYVNGIAAQYGVTGECAVYGADALTDLLAQGQ